MQHRPSRRGKYKTCPPQHAQSILSRGVNIMRYRIYDPENDRQAGHRIWRETGWVNNDDDEKAMDHFLAGARALVSDLHGEAECLVASVPGDVRYLDQDLPLSVMASVATSRVARKQGMAGRLT